MHQSLSERWNRISLRTKITSVTVLMLTFGLLVSGIGTAAMMRSYVEQQLQSKLETIAGGGLEKYFEDDGAQPRRDADVDDLDLNPAEDVFVAIYDPDTGALVQHNWESADAESAPKLPAKFTLVQVDELNDGGFTMFRLPDRIGDPSFRAVSGTLTADGQGSLAPIIIAISSQESERLLTAYLTIFLGFGVGVVIVGALLTRMLVTTTFTPLREVERTAAAIADGDFSQRLGGATPNTEVGRLNRSLNTMLNRIDRAFRDRARTIDQMRRFVGDASHELRTPLVSVRGYAELYRMGALQTPEEVGQAMDRIEKEAIRMGGLVEDLLALARLDEAKPLTLAEVDLVPLARDAALDAMASSPGRVVTVIAPEDVPVLQTGPADAAAQVSAPTELEVDLDSAEPRAGAIAFAGATLARLRGRRTRADAPAPARRSTPASTRESARRRGLDRNGRDRAAAAATSVSTSVAEPPVTEPLEMPVRQAIVLAEENKIRQVLTNLMGNAVRFAPADSPIEIRIEIDDENERARVSVVDHGEGIPPQIREKIFQRFWRADTSRARETGGSGLGLAIVSSIVSAHNGTVDVVETPGGGATFRFMLPLAGSAAAPQSVNG